MGCAIGGLQKCAKFIRFGDTFGGCWLLLILLNFKFVVVHLNFAHICAHIMPEFLLKIRP